MRHLALLLLGLALLHHADAHGFLMEPISRQFRAYLYRNADYAHGAGRAGGPAVVSGGKVWPGTAGHGICGDTVNNKTVWDIPGPVDPGSVLVAGQVVVLKVLVATNHLGRFGFKLCPLLAKSEAQCLDLQRADGKGSWWYMPQTKDSSGGATFGNSEPIEADGFFSFSLMPKWRGTCMGQLVCDQFIGMGVYSLPYKLPGDLAPGRYKLQWYYLTGNSCYPPCTKEAPVYPQPSGNCNPFNYPFCGDTSQEYPYPEEFWNCADVEVTRSGTEAARLAAAAPLPAAVADLAAAVKAAARHWEELSGGGSGSGMAASDGGGAGKEGVVSGTGSGAGGVSAAVRSTALKLAAQNSGGGTRLFQRMTGNGTTGTTTSSGTTSTSGTGTSSTSTSSGTSTSTGTVPGSSSSGSGSSGGGGSGPAESSSGSSGSSGSSSSPSVKGSSGTVVAGDVLFSSLPQEGGAAGGRRLRSLM